LNSFIFALEFNTLCRQYGIRAFRDERLNEYLLTAFVSRFFWHCLDRDPDPVGLNGWVKGLQNGNLKGSDVATEFVFSQEFLNRDTSAEEFLYILYAAFFGREPDAAGLQDWLVRLEAGASRHDVLAGFMYAQEFYNLCQEYKIDPY